MKSKRDVNKVTKSECAPEKREATEPIRSIRETEQAGLGAPTGLGAPAALGAPFQTDPAEAEKIKELVTGVLTQLSQKPDSRKYG